jgi:branched-chain amino acid transport system ATP-binding protein
VKDIVMQGFSIPVFIGLTIVLFGGASFMMGQAIADTWRPVWQNVVYGLLLAAANRFLDGALFHGAWFSPWQYVLDAVVIIAIALFAYRLTAARQMVSQYPWLYEKSGLMTWRERDTGR